MLYAFAAEHNIAHSRCGKVIVATRPEEVERLPGLLARGESNGLTGLKLIDSQEIKAIEPFVEGLQGIWVPHTGWIDFAGTTRALVEQAQQQSPNTRIFTNSKYLHHQERGGLAHITTSNGALQARHLVFCGGLQADRLAVADGLNPGLRIVGFRGDYYEMTPSGAAKVRNLIYPVPNPEFPFLGVHFTRMHDGSVECGPNAVFTFKREGYQRGDFSLRDTSDALGYGGTWRLFAKHWQNGLMEMRRAWSKPLFLKTLQQLIPALEMADLGHHRAGVRAQALNPDGTLVDDFVILRGHRSVHILNAPSPAATACLSIGLRVASEVRALLEDHG
jgi:L-2-hydroxyglutarate oxidase LhgO